MEKGKILIEGMDLSGKTTITKYLSEILGVNKIQSRTFGTVGYVCECCQSYQEEANWQPYNWIAYLQNQE